MEKVGVPPLIRTRIKRWAREREAKKNRSVNLSRPISFQKDPMQASVATKIDFITNDKFTKIRSYLGEYIQEIPEARNQKFYIIRGPMGVGKTRIVWKAVETACSSTDWIPVYVNMVNVLRIPGVQESTPDNLILSSALFYAFTRVLPSDVGVLNIIQVTEEIAKAQGGSTDKIVKIILHIDEFQDNLETCFATNLLLIYNNRLEKVQLLL